MVAEPALEPVERDPTLVAASEESATSKKEKEEPTYDVSTEAPLDIWAAEYPDGGARAWLVVFGVSEFQNSRGNITDAI